VPSSCTLLGTFAFGTWVSLLWQHSTEGEMSVSACIRSMPGFNCDGIFNNDLFTNSLPSLLLKEFLANVNSRSRSLYAIARPTVVCRLPVRLSSVTFVRPTQAVQIFVNISTVLGTLAILGHPLKILRRSSQGNPSAGGVKDKRGSQI